MAVSNASDLSHYDEQNISMIYSKMSNQHATFYFDL